MDFDGYAIGGLSVGEPRELTLEMIAEVLPLLPKDKPRYVMGVGYPDEIEQYARMGVDMMDCVLPTRAARHALLFTSEGRINIKNKQYAEDQGPPDPACNCMVCRRYSRAYLRHLMQAGEALSRNAEHDSQPCVLPGHHAARARRTGLQRERLDLSGSGTAANLPPSSDCRQRMPLRKVNRTLKQYRSRERPCPPHPPQCRVPLAERDQVPEEITILYDQLLAERGVVPNMFKALANVPPWPSESPRFFAG